MKITNNLLAAVLILTVVPPYVGFSEAALEYCCSLVSQKLLEKQVCHSSSLFIIKLTSVLGVRDGSTLREDDRHGGCFG